MCKWCKTSTYVKLTMLVRVIRRMPYLLPAVCNIVYCKYAPYFGLILLPMNHKIVSLLGQWLFGISVFYQKTLKNILMAGRHGARL